MAEYRGLTIRIGADTGSLTASLRAASSAISATQKQARLLKQALVMDPGSNKSAALYIGELQSQSVAATSKVRALKDEMQNLGDTMSKASGGKTIMELAEQTDNAALSARRAKEAYNEVTESLAEMYTELTELSKATFGKEDGKTFNHEKNNDLLTMRAEYQKLVAAGAVSQSDADEAIMRIARLKRSFTELSDAYDDAKLVEQLHNDEISAARLEAQIHALAEEMADAARSDLSRSLEDGAKAMERVSAVIESAKKNLDNADKAFEIDATSVDAAYSKESALVGLQDTLKTKLDLVNESIGKLESAGVGDLANFSNIAEELEKARALYVGAEEVVQKLESARDNAQEIANSIKANDGPADQWRAATEEVKQYDAQIDEAKGHLEETRAAYTKLKDANTLLEMRNDAGELSNSLAEVAQKMRAFSNEVADSLKSKLSATIEENIAAIERLAKGVALAQGKMSNADTAFELDPTSIGAVFNKIEALVDVQGTLRLQLEQTNAAMQELNDAGVDQAVVSMTNLSEKTEEARQRFVDASQVVMQLQKDSSATDEQLEQARAAMASAGEEYARMKDANTFAELSNQAGDLNNKLGETSNKMREMANQVADALRSSVSDAIDDSVASIERLSSGVSHAQGGLSNADNALAFDPTNLDAVAAKTKALTELQDALRVKLEATNAAIAKMEAAGLGQMNMSMAELAQKTEEARQDFVRMQQDVANAEAALRDGTGTEEGLERAKEAAAEMGRVYARLKDENALAEMRVQAGDIRSELRGVTEQFQEMSRSSLSISLDGDREALAGITQDAELAKQRFENLDKALKLDPTNVDLIKARAEALADAEEKARIKVDALRSILERLKAAGLDKVVKDTENLTQKTKESETNYRRATEEVNRLKGELAQAQAKQESLENGGDDLGDGYADAARDVERLANELEDAENAAAEAKQQMDLLHDATEYVGKGVDFSAAEAELNGFASRFKDQSDDISTAFFQAMQEIGQWAKTGISNVVTASYDLEEAYTNMLKTVDGTDEQYNELKESAVAASLENPVSADQILNVEALGGQLGFAIDELQEFQRVANGLDISTNMSWEDAATNMAQFANIMGMSHDNVGRYGAAIVDLGNNFATTEADISDMAMRIAGAGATLNLSEADVLGLSAALTSMGLTAEAGGSSISQIMIKIEKAVANGTDGIKNFASQAGMSVEDFVAHVNSLDDDALKEFAKQFGMTGTQLTKSTTDAYAQLETWAETAGYDSASKFAEAWQKAPIEALQNIFKGMDPEKLADDESNLSLLLDKLGVKTIRQSDVARRLANSNELLVQTVEAANRAWEENAALDTEVERRNESLSGRMDVVKNSLTAIKTEFGEGLAPMVNIAAGALQGIVTVLDALPDVVKTGIIGMGGLLVAVTGLGMAVVAVRGGLMKFIPLLGVAASNALKNGGIIAGLTVGLGGLQGAITAAGTALWGFLTTAGGAVAVVGTLAAAVATAAIQHQQHQQAVNDFEGSLKSLNKTNEKYAETTEYGAHVTSDLGRVVEEFPQTMGIKEVTQELKDFNQSIEDTMHPVEESNAILGKYKDIIDELGGKQKATASDMASLEWAVNGINDAFGTSFTAQDILVGKYKDEQTEIGNLITYLDRLIEKRQLEAEMEAAQEVYTDALKEQMKLEAERDAARKKYQDQLSSTLERYEELGTPKTEEWLLSDANQENAGLRKLHEDYIALDRAVAETAETTDVFHQKMTDLTQDSSLYDYLVNAFPDESFAWGDALDKAGISFLDFADAMEEAGMGVQDLEGIYHDGTTYFADLVEQSGGDIDKLIGIIQEYNATHIEEKEVEVDTSDVQKKMDEVGSEYDFAVDVVANNKTEEGLLSAKVDIDGMKQEAEANPVQLNAQNNVLPAVTLANSAYSSIPPEVNTSINADVKTGEKNLGYIKAAADAVPKETNTKSNADTAEATKNVNDFTAILNAVPGSISTILHTNFDDEIAKANTLIGKISAINNNPAKATSNTGKSATGSVGAAPFIPRHASGYIATGPTLTNNGWVGEDGIEVIQNWATGGAVVPLTNKKYMLPIADAIAAGMISRGAGTGNNTTIEVHLNYKAGDDANKMARDLASAIARVQRTRR